MADLWEIGALDEDEDDVFGRFGAPSSPQPWYRTSAAVLAMVAIGIAVVAIIVSAVLLMSRGSRAQVRDTDEPAIVTTPSTAPPTTLSPTATVAPSPTAPPPSEPPVSAPPASAPVAVEPPRQQPPPPAKPPEIGVTRTPVTRSPISVRPAPRPAYPHN